MNMQSTFRATRFGRGGVSIRARNGSPIAMEEVQRLCPSVFAVDKHSSRSDKFTFIDSTELLNGMLREGFGLYEVRQGGSGDEEKRGFTKHMLKFRHASEIGPSGQYYQTGVSEFKGKKVGDSIHEVCLINAHDGTSSYQVFSGWFKIACLNGLITADMSRERQSIRIPHKGNILDQVVEASYQVIDSAQEQALRIEHMRAVPLNAGQRDAFAEAAAVLRFDDSIPENFGVRKLLEPRRRDDMGSDVWTTFNVVQENLIKGGLHFRRTQDMRNGAGDIVGQRQVDASTRAVHSIDGDVKLNRALWILAERMAQLAA